MTSEQLKRKIDFWGGVILVLASMAFLSSCIPEPAAAEGVIRDDRGRTVGRIEEHWTGDTVVRDRRGRTVLYVDPRTGKLHRKNGQSVGTVKLPEKDPGSPTRDIPKNRWTGTWEERWGK